MFDDSALQKYLLKFRKLRVDRTHGIAPHKPILLLSVLLAYLQGQYTSRKVYLTPELVGLFKSAWSLLVRSSHDCRITYPFYHMKNEGFWNLVPKDKFIEIDFLGSAVKSFNRLNAAVEYALIDEDLFCLMRDRNSNMMLIQFLISNYFPGLKIEIEEILNLSARLQRKIEHKILFEPAVEYRAEIKRLLEEKNEEDVYLRGGFFKREIPKIYNNTCCISGLRVDSVMNISMIDACHIIPFSESYDDTITNGVTLCPNLHRAFDRGLITIDLNYRILISPCFSESESIYSIKKFEGKEISLPTNKQYWPAVQNLQWHREKMFKSG